ncbi:hypothetical protein GCM10007424_25030 [Flavobacterium suaedae]|uniref:Uncharacterized protein n=1 Tax=Flavobacterium suaedae TaxID=1767027 RepID=A0ABQ1K4M6_9FLAO|nr:hypothetical protein [Flavobacterium suaedae]GGB84024.1 hypothetical protein GCM10007424_25030 [Flavobacterium suaedae]
MKTVATITMLFVMLTAFAQFPRKDPVLLKGHQLEVKVLSENVLKYDSGYEHFFFRPELHKNIYG